MWFAGGSRSIGPGTVSAASRLDFEVQGRGTSWRVTDGGGWAAPTSMPDTNRPIGLLAEP